MSYIATGVVVGGLTRLTPKESREALRRQHEAAAIADPAASAATEARRRAVRAALTQARPKHIPEVDKEPGQDDLAPEGGSNTTKYLMIGGALLVGLFLYKRMKK